MTRRLAALLIAGALAPLCLRAQTEAPQRVEQLIYSLMSYNGRDYSPTFCRAQEKTICVIARAETFLSVRTTLVYYWPITGDWHTDSQTLNMLHQGTIELEDSHGRIASLEPVTYTYYSLQGRYNQEWKIAVNQEALREWARYDEAVSAYREALSAYTLAKATWDEEYAALATEIAALRDSGKPYQGKLELLESMQPPREPQPPGPYLVPPARPRTGYILRLSPGTYRMRFLTPDGLVLEGSDKTVIAFSREGGGQIGYDVIPADRWTHSGESNTASSVLYTDGSADLYVRPFYQEEYNDLYYRKTVKNDASGNPNMTTWVKVQQVELASIQVRTSDGRMTVVMEQPYYVEQSEGSVLGYAIVPFDPEGAHRGLDPTLRAFLLPLSRGTQVMHLELFDAEGRFLKDGERQIRIVRRPRRPLLPLAAVLLPLLGYLTVLGARRRSIE